MKIWKAMEAAATAEAAESFIAWCEASEEIADLKKELAESKAL